MKKAGQIKILLEELISFLKSINDDDKNLAIRSIGILKKDLKNYKYALLGLGWGRLGYSIGGKGIHNLGWSVKNEQEITNYTDQIASLL